MFANGITELTASFGGSIMELGQSRHPNRSCMLDSKQKPFLIDRQSEGVVVITNVVDVRYLYSKS